VHTQIVELRQYKLRPGRRDELIELFDAHLVESQEEVGMSVIGQFRDLDRPDRFVWLRGFSSMDERRASLEAFYTGPVWRAHSKAANETMLETDDVLLLRPATPDSAFTLDGSTRGAEAGGEGPGFVGVAILDLDGGEPAEALERVELRDGAALLGCLVTDPSPNTFPALPVREGENVLASFSGYADRDALELASGDGGWLLRLAPTSRSLLHGHSPACGATKGDR
jgi:quinol monooxygenase YgiN